MRTVCVLPSQSFAAQMPALPKGEPRSRCEFFALRTNQTCLSLWERCRAATERAGSLFEGAASYLSRIRQTLARTRQRAAPSVTACAVPPFSGRKAFVLHANKNRASFDTLSLGGRWWIRFSAEKPRRLQHASSMLPRAGFRIHCSYSQS